MSGPERLTSIARWIALAYLLLLPVQAWPLVTFRNQPVLVPDALLVVAWSAAGVAFVASRGRGAAAVAKWALGGAAFLATLALSAVVNARPGSSFLKLAAFAPMILAPAMLRWLFPTAAEAMRALTAFAAGCVLALVVGAVTIVVFYVRRDAAEAHLMCGYGALHSSGGYPRICAPFRNFNMHCDYLIATVPLAITFVALARGRWLALGLALFASAVALCTLSAGIGGFAIALAVAVVPLLGEGRPGRVLRAATWAGAILVEVAFVLASLGTLVARGAGSLAIGARDYAWWDGSRAAILSAAARTFVQHPLFGIGYGSSVARVTDPRAFVPADQIALGKFPPFADMEAHDLVLSVAGQAGIVGLVAFAVLVGALVLPLLRARPAGADARIRRVVLGSVAGVVVVHGVFIAVEEARHFWPLLAMAPLAAVLGADRPRLGSGADAPEPERDAQPA